MVVLLPWHVFVGDIIHKSSNPFRRPKKKILFSETFICISNDLKRAILTGKMGNAFFCHGGDNKRTTTSARESTLYQKLTKGGRQKNSSS